MFYKNPSTKSKTFVRCSKATAVFGLSLKRRAQVYERASHGGFGQAMAVSTMRFVVHRPGISSCKAANPG